MKQPSLVVTAGALFAIAFFILADGCVSAKRSTMSYNFLMWLPAIIGLSGSFVLLFIRPRSLLSPDEYEEYDDSIARTKILFFLASLLFFASICVAIWKMIDPYSNSGADWPGVAILLNALLLVLMNIVLFFARLSGSHD